MESKEEVGARGVRFLSIFKQSKLGVHQELQLTSQQMEGQAKVQEQAAEYAISTITGTQ
jgi:hypothetical protein